MLAKPFRQCGDQANLGSTMRAIAQMKPASSRAIATTTLGVGLPAATSLRYRAESRTCAFQATLRIGSGKPARRSRMICVTRAGNR